MPIIYSFMHDFLAKECCDRPIRTKYSVETWNKNASTSLTNTHAGSCVRSPSRAESERASDHSWQTVKWDPSHSFTTDTRSMPTSRDFSSGLLGLPHFSLCSHLLLHSTNRQSQLSENEHVTDHISVIINTHFIHTVDWLSWNDIWSQQIPFHVFEMTQELWSRPLTSDWEGWKPADGV